MRLEYSQTLTEATQTLPVSRSSCHSAGSLCCFPSYCTKSPLRVTVPLMSDTAWRRRLVCSCTHHVAVLLWVLLKVCINLSISCVSTGQLTDYHTHHSLMRRLAQWLLQPVGYVLCLLCGGGVCDDVLSRC